MHAYAYLSIERERQVQENECVDAFNQSIAIFSSSLYKEKSIYWLTMRSMLLAFDASTWSSSFTDLILYLSRFGYKYHNRFTDASFSACTCVPLFWHVNIHRVLLCNGAIHFPALFKYIHICAILSRIHTPAWVYILIWLSVWER